MGVKSQVMRRPANQRMLSVCRALAAAVAVSNFTYTNPCHYGHNFILYARCEVLNWLVIL